MTIRLNIRICPAHPRRIARDQPIQARRALLSFPDAAVSQQQIDSLAHTHRSESRPSASLPEFLGLLENCCSKNVPTSIHRYARKNLVGTQRTFQYAAGVDHPKAT